MMLVRHQPPPPPKNAKIELLVINIGLYRPLSNQLNSLAAPPCSLQVLVMDQPPCREKPLASGGAEDSSSSPVVGLSLCDSAPLLWRVEDLKTVRSQGLVGALLGSLPRTPRQNGRLGRPLLLLPEEERLLTERHAAATLPAGNQVS